jgi:hypothetical protein
MDLFAAKQMAETIRQDRRRGDSITRVMIVEERIENKNGILFELRNSNPAPLHDDRMTLVFKAGDDEPQWRVGTRVKVELSDVG